MSEGKPTLAEQQEAVAGAIHAIKPHIVNGAMVTGAQVLGVLHANGWSLIRDADTAVPEPFDYAAHNRYMDDVTREIAAVPDSRETPEPDDPLRIMGAVAHDTSRDHEDNDDCIVCVAARPVLARLRAKPPSPGGAEQ